MNKQLLAHAAMLGATFIYGGNYSIAKIVLDDEYIQPVGFILLRVIVCLVLFALTHILFIREKVDSRDFTRLLICATFGIAINMCFFFLGLKQTTPINASLIMTTTPILVLIASAILLKEAITKRKVLGITIGALGAVVLIAYGQQISFTSHQLIGDILIFLNAASYAIYLVVVKKLMDKYHQITILRWIFTLGVVMVLPFGISDLHQIQWESFSITIWMAVAYVCLLATFGTHLLNVSALRVVNPSVVSIYMYLQPIIAAVVAIGLGKDQWTTIKGVSMCLIFLGVYLVSTKRKAALGKS
ncbi:MAG: DMT family transporter [Bacteroidota bacterium]